MSITQLIAREVDTLLYEKLHSLLGMIAADHDLDHGALVEKYLIKCRDDPAPQIIYKTTESKKTRAKKIEASDDEREGKCTATTAKGTPCKNKCCGGGVFCHIHNKKKGETEEKPKKKAAKKAKKAKKEPEHTHKLDEPAEDCELCETHGNPMEGEQEFEVAEEQKESIKKLIEAELEEGEISESEIEAEIEAEMERNAIEDGGYSSEEVLE